MTDIKEACHCKNVRWSAVPPAVSRIRCHCGNCRQLSGADYSTYVVVPEEAFQVIQGQAFLSQYQDGISSRSFCQKCGTTVFLNNGKHFPGHVVLPLGIIEGDTDALTPQAHVYVTDKAEWGDIPEGETGLS